MTLHIGSMTGNHMPCLSLGSKQAPQWQSAALLSAALGYLGQGQLWQGEEGQRKQWNACEAFPYMLFGL